MRLHRMHLPLTAMLALLAAGATAPRADIKGVTPAKSPAPYYAEYNVKIWSPQEAPPSDEDVARQESRYRRELRAKGYSAKAADALIKQTDKVFRMPSGGDRHITECFGVGKGQVLTETREIEFPLRTIIKSDRWLRWDRVRHEKGASFPIITVFSIDPKTPPKKTEMAQEAVIFGLAPIESLFVGNPPATPLVTRATNGVTAIKYVIPEGDMSAGYIISVVLDPMGRITTITRQGSAREKHRWFEEWKIANYVKANDGWLPGVIDRQVHKGDKLLSTLHYRLDNIETGQPVVDQWFSNHVNQPSFVYDSRFFGVTVKYFTKKEYLPDEEVKRRAEQIAMAQGGQSPVQKPNSPWRAAGVFLVMVGCAGLVWWFGWPRKAAG